MNKGLVIAPGLDDFIANYTIKETNPEHIAFLVTDKTFKQVSNILEHNNIKSYKIFFIKDIFSTTETVNEFLNAFNWIKKQDINKLYIDATNCITVIEMGTYVTASLLDIFHDTLQHQIDFKFVYVHSEYEYNSEGIATEIRGTEKLVELEKPVESLNFVLAIDATKAFNQRRYRTAYTSFNNLSKNNSGDKHLLYKGIAYLSLSYEKWDKMDFAAAIENLNKANKNLKSVKNNNCVNNIINSIEQNIKSLQSLEKKDSINIILDLHSNAHRRIDERRYDDAIGRLYACLERITQHQLRKYNIITKKPDYSNLSKEAVEKFEKQLGFLPKELELKKNGILLSILDDPIGQLLTKIKINKFIGLVGLRNKSILAHGISPITKQNLQDFKQKLFDIFFEEFIKIENICKEDIDGHKHLKINNINDLM